MKTKNPFPYTPLLIALVIIVSTAAFVIRPSVNSPASIAVVAAHGKPEISGWIAWWKEAQGFNVVERHPDAFKNVAPYWFDVARDPKGNWMVAGPGTTTKKMAVERMHEKGILVYPLVSTELKNEELTGLLDNDAARKQMAIDLANQMMLIGADGLDMDIEVVSEGDRDNYTAFLAEVASELKKRNAFLAVSVLAQTGADTDWSATKGQDLKAIGALADEVRVLAYDKHADGTIHGPVSDPLWQKKVLNYISKHIAPSKIVVGIPVYGYTWPKGTTNAVPLQFDEFMATIGTSSAYTVTRDAQSHELYFESTTTDAWLADGESTSALVESARALGFNRFAIWNLGGIDENIFVALDRFAKD